MGLPATIGLLEKCGCQLSHWFTILLPELIIVYNKYFILVFCSDAVAATPSTNVNYSFLCLPPANPGAKDKQMRNLWMHAACNS
jgi:hypothetical protein